MKKVHIIAGVLTAALIAAAFAGCGEKSETQDVSAMKQEQGEAQNAPQGQRGTMAKVVSLDGNQLTVILADRPGDGQAPPSGGNGPGQPGQGGGKMEFTGEQTTYTLSDDVAIMKGSGDNAAEIDLSELKADDVIRFTTVADDSGSETIDAIIVTE
jgi:hypothetical protein